MIIESLLDTDLYKLTMGQIVLHKFPNAIVEYQFKCRTKDIDLIKCSNQIESEIKYLCSLKFKNNELDYLRSLSFLKNDYIDFLEDFQLKFKYVSLNFEDGELEISIKGPWRSIIYFEVPILAIVNEIYFYSNNYHTSASYKSGENRLDEKIKLVKKSSFSFADFGTRRRFSRDWHEKVIKKLKQFLPDSFIGTSNVYFAMTNNLRPIGTMAHEFLQAAQALGPRLVDSQKFALESWVQEYRGDLGIALSDVVGMDAFLRDFDLYFCKLFDGARHDSGDPFDWCDKLIAHYYKMGIDPKTKTAVFSDGLTFPLALELVKKYKGKINTSFGIGTNLTNDLGPQPISIVMKMTQCDGQPVAKISDSSGKTMCKDEKYLDYLKHVFKIK